MLAIFEKDHLHSFNISEVIPSEKYGYFNAPKTPVSEYRFEINVLS